jgi:putrescine transport system substrate-binding protein
MMKRFLLACAGLCLVAHSALAEDAPAPAAPAAPSKLYIYNWSEYFAPDTLEKFEKETGIKVVYDVYDSNDMLEAKLYAGNTGYDLVFPTNFPYFFRQQAAGVYQPLDTTKLPDLKNSDPALVNPLKKDGKLYATPYMWGSFSIGVNVDKVAPLFDGKIPDSWDLIFNPENMKKLSSCKVAFIDSPVYVYPILMNFLGLPRDSTDYAQYEQASAVMRSVRPYITYFHDSQYMNDLANGNVCVAFGWSGDLVLARNRAKESGNKINIKVINPKEGSLLLYDVVAMPKDAKNVDAALQFMNFLMRPEIAAEITDYVGFPNAIPASTKLLAPGVAEDPAVYPPESTRKNLFTPPELPLPLEKQLHRDWARMRASR